jgi:hypothetical protein
VTEEFPFLLTRLSPYYDRWKSPDAMEGLPHNVPKGWPLNLRKRHTEEKMRLPSFSAESSLYKTGQFYRGWGGASGGTAEASAIRAGDRSLPLARARGSAQDGVHPSLHKPPKPTCGDCIWDTFDYPAPGTCAQLCLDPGDYVPYPVECDPSQCPVQCGRCLGYLSGSFQHCRGGRYGSGAWVSCAVQPDR